VFFHGSVSDMREVWRKNHLLIMPSHMEGMPLAVVEAMLCGRPSVATDVGGILEWITDGVTGYIAGAATLACLDEALERAWRDKENWEAIGKAAHDRAVALCDPQPGKTLLTIIDPL
jgi:L-malate glycosyltransferase